MTRLIDAQPRVNAPWLLEVRMKGRPSQSLRARAMFAPGVVWDGICGCWIVPCELIERFVAFLEKE